MERTIMAGDRVIANRLSYLRQPPERFDVIVFKFPDDESVNYVKRVIGLPGETVELRAGQVYVNGALLDEGAYLNGVPTGDYGPFAVPRFSYFVLGDNRVNSHDSKNWRNPYVAENKILGKVLFGYYPEFKML
jgi:signal peptidase I